MQQRAYGSTGLRVPVLGFGAMQVGDPALGETHVERLLHHVLDAGLTLIDTARAYGLAEERIGRVLGRRRDEFVLSTKVGYCVPGIPDWTYECVLGGVDAARDRLRTDVIDLVHLHSCGLDALARGDVTRALAECRARGKIRVVAYSGDGPPLRFLTSPAAAGEVAQSVGEGGGTPGEGAFQGLQASVNLCDQQALPVLQHARARGLGTLAKRPLAGRPWAGPPNGDPVHDEYRRRYEQLRASLGLAVDDWDALALRYAAFAPGVDCVLVGGTDAANVDRNVAAVGSGDLTLGERLAITAAYEAHGRGWEGLV
jgi:aryl-alcohol dehydrogenase-like predicted oxidoreductase